LTIDAAQSMVGKLSTAKLTSWEAYAIRAGCPRPVEGQRIRRAVAVNTGDPAAGKRLSPRFVTNNFYAASRVEDS
jgi:hypothetical protein